eukprot:scaffold100877_cov32-Attheya_sp.AAC.1
MGDSAHSGGVEMSAIDFQLCLDVLDTLTSTEHSNLNVRALCVGEIMLLERGVASALTPPQGKLGYLYISDLM